MTSKTRSMASSSRTSRTRPRAQTQNTRTTRAARRSLSIPPPDLPYRDGPARSITPSWCRPRRTTRCQRPSRRSTMRCSRRFTTMRRMRRWCRSTTRCRRRPSKSSSRPCSCTWSCRFAPCSGWRASPPPPPRSWCGRERPRQNTCRWSAAYTAGFSGRAPTCGIS